MFSYLLEPFKFTWALLESLRDPELAYTVAVAQNCNDPLEVRARERFRSIDTTGALA